ncbi:hypothetical protein Droror1_Dr00014610 [Drosera rotundifolia]
MYSRHRSGSSAGNGSYRSNGVGVGVAAGIGISPDAAAAASSSTIRNYGRAPYPSDFNRNFNRPVGRGSPKSTSQPNPPLTSLPSKGADLLIEAGRLALDYLVFHGILSADLLLPTKTPNQSRYANTSLSDLHDRSPPTEEIPVSSFDAAGSRTRQFPDDYGSRTPVRDSSSPLSSRSHAVEENKWNELDGPLSNKTNAISIQDMEPDTDNDSALQHPKDGNGEFGISMSKTAKLVSDVDGPHGLRVEETEKDQHQPTGDVSATNLCSVSNFAIKAGDGIAQDSDEHDALFVYDSSESNIPGDPGGATGDLQCREAANTQGNNHLDLLKLCNPCNVPTKTRSSLLNKELKMDIFFTGSNAYGGAYRSSLGSDDHSAVPAKVVTDVARLASPPTSEPEICIDIQPSLEEIAIHEQGSQKPTSQLASLSSMMGNNGGKRVFEDDSPMEGSKKAKGWSSVMAKQDRLNSVVRQSGSMEWKDSSLGDSLLKKCLADPSAEGAEEKQLLTGSFKICDLNLLGSSDVSEVHGDSTLMYPSIPIQQEEVTVETDLSISNNSSSHNGYPKSGAAKDIELIDLEDDSLPEGGTFKNSTTPMQAELKGSASFQDHAQILSESAHTQDGQDGYGLMISELIGTDIQECSSVQLHPNLSPSHNDMNLHHGEGLLNDDDQIFMSLGEISLSFLQVWEQPTQDYEKPF